MTVPKPNVVFRNAFPSRTLLGISLLAFPMLIAGCKGGAGGNGAVTPVSNAAIDNPWVFGFTSSSSGISGSSTNLLVVNANLRLSSPVQSTGVVVIRACIRPSFSSESVNGSVSGSNVSLTLAFGGVMMLLTGTLSADGSSMSGNYTMNGACGNDTGTWRGSKVLPINGAYIGSLLGSNSATVLNASISGNLVSTSDGAVTGTFSINSTCFKGNLSVTGTQTGLQFGGTGTGNLGDSIEFAFASNDLGFQSMTGGIQVDTGSCAGDFAGATLAAQNGTGGGGTGTNAVPILTALSPSKVAGFILSVTVYGSNFTINSQVLIDGNPVLTGFGNSGALNASVNATLGPGTHLFSVRDVGGTSNSLPYIVYVPGTGPQPFGAVSKYPTGAESDPTSVAVADLDGSGRSAVILPGSGSLAILQGQPNGTLSAPTYISGIDAYALATGDVNGDSRIDIVAVSSANPLTVTTLINQGSGNFGKASSGATVNGSFPLQAVLANMYGSGKPDLVVSVVSPNGGYAIYLLKNDGTGAFGSPQVIATPQGPTVPSFSVADFNGDGRPDLIYTTSNSLAGINEVHLLLNQGNGSFSDALAPGIQGANSASAYVGYLIASDFNLDGCPDVALQIAGDVPLTLQVYLSNCNGTFKQVSNSVIGPLGTPSFYTLVTGDFDHDGLPDLAGIDAGIGSPQVLLLWGDGQGNFTSQQVNGPVGSATYRGVSTGDINGDGLPDILVPDTSGGISVVLGHTDRNFFSPSTLTPNNVGLMSVGDVNGDGIPDLFFAGAVPGSIAGTTFLGNGDSSFQPGANAPPGGLLVADLNHDGLADLIGTDGTNLLVWPGTKDPHFSSSPMVVGPAPNSLLSPFPTVKVADIDGDGNPDIIVAGTIYFGHGDFQFDVVHIPFSAPFVIGDFNNDGRLDIMSGLTFLNLGNRTFTSVTSGANLGEAPVSLVVGDFNKDGLLDVASLDNYLNTVWVNYGRGDGTFLLHGEINFSDQLANAMVVGDFNGDGLPDIIVGFGFTSQIALLTNDSQGGFLLSYFATGKGTAGLVTADFNNDGQPDVAVLSGAGSALVMLHK